MNHEIARKWSAALRSGEYKQQLGSLGVQIDPATGALRSDEGCRRCALGVLREVLMKEEPTLSATMTGGIYLSSAERDRAGLHTNQGDFRDGFKVYGRRKITVLNDREMLPFVKIAEVIDQHWEKL
jgi:hypothetical protein